MTGQQVMARLRERDGDGDIMKLIHCIAKVHSVTLEEMLGDTHEHPASSARQQLWYELYMTGHWSYPRIAKVFGRKSHQTVMEGIRSHCRREGLAPPGVGQGRRYIPPGEATLPTSKEVA